MHAYAVDWDGETPSSASRLNGWIVTNRGWRWKSSRPRPPNVLPAICASTWEMGPPPPEAASCASSSVAEAPGHAPMNLNATNGASKRRSRRPYTKRCSSIGQPSGKAEPLALLPASVFLSLLDYRLEPDAHSVIWWVVGWLLAHLVIVLHNLWIRFVVTPHDLDPREVEFKEMLRTARKAMHAEELVERMLRRNGDPNLTIQHFARALPPPRPINE